jgi:hypothetical protein
MTACRGLRFRQLAGTVPVGSSAFGYRSLANAIVFTDINLAGRVTGWDVAERFRIDPPNLPILYTSGKIIEPERRVPGSVFLSKPYQRGEVLIACGWLLGK